ncbi:alcohol dehydrogenase catalytic domain-containing protein [Lacticaseibacillus parakribbianus]|uniref:alcohol dehydrogenase catalytic domain-containing protein n=1 Tax=Lacticaseibacillus parakribbianus TaxID=2970927 RepID=UPI0021CAF546|nr:zinc-binding dehydrogenase [Lacticaseibacillus parakribbianus]
MSDNNVLAATPGGFTAQTRQVPEPGPTDLLVQVLGSGLNPIDLKLAEGVSQPTVLGFDAVGQVVAIGPAVTDFAPGERVFYAGTTKRPGSFADYQLVQAALAAKAPASLPLADLAALPLVGLTAWELLFEKMGFTPQPGANAGQRLVVVNGAGGVGSLLTQLAAWSGLEVWATASPANWDWLAAHGVAQPLDYHRPLTQTLAANSAAGVAILYAPEPYLAQAAALVAPFGHVATLVTPRQPLDVTALKAKAASLDFEYMFAKSDFNHQVASQGAILRRLAALAAAGTIQASVTTHYADRSLDNLKAGLQKLAAGHVTGKIVLTGKVHL